MAKTFPFFRLPRELRDRIYAEVGGAYPRYDIECPAKEGVIVDPNDDYEEDVKAYPCTPRKDMLRVCRAFKAEYEMEIRRRATLSVTAHEDDVFPFPPKKLIKGGRAHRCFRSIPHLEIELPGGSKPFLEVYEQVLAAFLPFMDNLKTITYAFTFRVPATKRDDGASAPSVLKTILDKDGPLWSSGKLNVPITNRIYIKSFQFCLSEHFGSTALASSRYPSFQEYVNEGMVRSTIQGQRFNQITYSATPSADDGQFWGLDLEVHGPTPAIDFADVARVEEGEYHDHYDSDDHDHDYGYDYDSDDREDYDFVAASDDVPPYDIRFEQVENDESEGWGT
ncbi:hypothetical protein PRZ48_009578 [Zasmidium cellare]|uniref:Uncharacterized protein n=1 Tax=Zasmidium cellare TaxID=395010 RepID=A0ABR0EC36_ZASCE|nr:hypothetical protein PRZ48_009578 [Zasmidium cellare]